MKISETPHCELSPQVKAAFAVCGQVIQETWGGAHAEVFAALNLRSEATNIFRMLQRTYEESDVVIRACVRAADLGAKLDSLRRELLPLEKPFPKNYTVALSEEQRADILSHVRGAIEQGCPATIFLAADDRSAAQTDTFRPPGVSFAVHPRNLHQRGMDDEWALDMTEFWRPARSPLPALNRCIGIEEGQFLHYHEHEDWSTLTCELFLAPRSRSGREALGCLETLTKAIAVTQSPTSGETVADSILRWRKTLGASGGTMNVTTAESLDY